MSRLSANVIILTKLTGLRLRQSISFKSTLRDKKVVVFEQLGRSNNARQL